MKARQVDSYLSNKLGYAREEKRHIHFSPRVGNNKLSLPTIIALPRSSGDVSDNVIRGIAEALGLREKDLRTSTECHIGAACVYVCQAGYCVRFCCTSLVADPQVHRENAMGLSVSIDRLLRAADSQMKDSKTWNRLEAAALAYMLKRIEQGSIPAELKQAITSIGDLIRRYTLE